MQELDGLRALAFFAILWHHWAPQYQFGLPLGAGVQLFFVLSGFLITGILLDYRDQCEQPDGPSKEEGLKIFYLRRFLRILPLFYAVLLGALILNVSNLRETWPWYFLNGANFLFAIEGDIPRNPLTHFWTLAVEEQFYLFWPGVILFARRSSLRNIILGLLLFAPLFRIGMSAAFPGWHRVNYLPFSCLDALSVGALLALVARDGTPQGASDSASALANRLGVIGLAGGAVSAVLLVLTRKAEWAESLGHTFLVVFFGWVVWRAATGFGWGIGAGLRWTPLVYLGKISYGLYVYHHFFTYLDFKPVLGAAGLPPEWANSLAVRFPLQFAFTLLLAAASWHFFESPLNDLKRHFTLRRSASGGRTR
jgi:peptidoglycan/LPS O-acetylase OafA/YrhL